MYFFAESDNENTEKIPGYGFPSDLYDQFCFSPMSETLTVSNFTQKAVVSNEKSAMIIECTSKQRKRLFMPGMCHARCAGRKEST